LSLLLSSSFFRTRQPATLYRIAKAKYANLAGVGAARYPGRWNRPGQEAIYTSTEVGVAILETLAHLRKDLIPSDLVIMTISVSGNWVDVKNGLVDPTTKGYFWRYETVAEAKHDFDSPAPMFGGGLNPFAIAVPSVIVPPVPLLNVVLYPRGIGFWNHVKLEDIKPFDLDSRLIFESTPNDPLT
jgi:RES domain-containing protein